MNTYAAYKESELFQVIQSSNLSEVEYNYLKNELEHESETNRLEEHSDTSERTGELIRLAIKHLCRVYPTFGVSQYKVTGVAHNDNTDVVEREVDATHSEQAKFYFHTRYDHKHYRVTSVVKLPRGGNQQFRRK